MRLYECDRCKAVNRVPAIRLDKQPVCGACGLEIEDFPFCRQIRRAWRHKALASFIVLFTALAAAFAALRPSIENGVTNAPVTAELVAS